MSLPAELSLLSVGCVAAFAVAAPRLLARARPSWVTWVLTLGSVAASLAGCLILAMLSLPALGRDDMLMDAVGVNPQLLDQSTGTGQGFGVVALLVLCGLTVRALRTAVRHHRAFRAASRFAHACGARHEQLVMIPSEVPDIYCLGGRPAVIVVTRGLARCMPADERRAALLHESAHIRHHHHRHLSAVAVCASLNPLLNRLPAASAYAVERWADEAAASATSRATISAALSRLAALTDAVVFSSTATLAAVAVSVAPRLAALREDPPRLAPHRLVAAAVLALGALLAAAGLTGHAVDVLSLTVRTTRHLVKHLSRSPR